MCRKQINYRIYFVGKSERCRRMAHLSCCEVLKKMVQETVKDVSGTRIFSGRTELQFGAAQLQTHRNTSESDGHVISTLC